MSAQKRFEDMLILAIARAMKEELTARARKENVSVAELVRRIVAKYLKEE